MSDLRITVLMTVYNAGSYLKEAVGSVLCQDFDGFELLIIDDCSSDGAIEALALQDSRVRVFRNHINIGQTASLNKGLVLAQGQWLARMDADDKAYPGWLRSQWNFVGQHPDCVAASCLAHVMDAKGEVYKTLRSPISLTDIILKSLFASPLNHVGVLMNKAVIVAQGGYPASLRIAADFALWSNLLRAGLILRNNPRVSVAIRAHQASVSSVNRGGADVVEISGILADNIKHFAHMEMTRDQLRQWCVFIYKPGELSVDQLIVMDGLLDSIYHQVDLKLVEGEARDVQKFLNAQRRIFLFKYFMVGMTQRPAQCMSKIFAYLIKRYGFFSFYGLLWLLTAGGVIFYPCSKAYEFLRRLHIVMRQG